MTRRILYACLLTTLFFCTSQTDNLLFAQQPCGTNLDEILQDAGQKQAYERSLQILDENRQKKSARMQESQKTSRNPNASRYVIPCVIHILYAEARDSISYDQVYSGMLNFYNDFRCVPMTRGYGGGMTDSGIEFVLASVDPNGQPTNGVKYYKVAPEDTRLSIREDNERLKMVLAPAWDTRRYLNIWLVRTTREGNTGYAQFPWSYNTGNGRFTDGVVAFNSTFGTIGTSVVYHYTPTHEIGHWINLFHTFQDGCGTRDCLRSGDRICDTPPVNLFIAWGDNSLERNNSCREEPFDYPDRSRNYMNYSIPNSAPNYFSPEQVKMFHDVLENTDLFAHRYNLWQNRNLEQTGAAKSMKPKANFWAETRNTCTGTEVTFIDYTFGLPNRWEWEFPGGTPATSNDPNPKVKYNIPGRYTVKLKVWNDSPTPDSVTKAGFITVEDAQQEVIEITESEAFLENFNEANPRDFFGKGWYLEDPDSGTAPSYSWDILKRVNGFDQTEPDGSGVARFSHYLHTQYGSKDGMVSPLLRAKGLKNLALHFDLSYATLIYTESRRANGMTMQLFDSLAIYVAPDCSNQWQRVWYKGGMELQTTARTPRTNNNGEGGDLSEPRADDWKNISFSLPNHLLNAESFRIKFETISGFGNYLYVDNIQVDGSETVSAQQAMQELNLKLYPNPVEEEKLTISFSLPNKGNLSLELCDVQGRSLIRQHHEEINAGPHQKELSLNGLAEGVYLLKIKHNDHFITQKVVKQ